MKTPAYPLSKARPSPSGTVLKWAHICSVNQTAHLANSTRYTQQSSIEHHESSIKNPFCLFPLAFCPLFSISVENPLQIARFLYKRTQFRKQPKSSQPHSPQHVTKKQPLWQDPKTNPNEPKANPVFRPSGAPKAKTNPNKPKTNPISQKPKNQRNIFSHKGLPQ